MDMQLQILSAASRIARIVSDLVAFSRPEPQESGSVDVRDAVEWAIRSTAHEFRHRARLTTKLKKVPRVDADETRLGQILVSLLINAAHSIAPVEGNEVSVTTSTDGLGRVVIEVTDTGSGIAPETEQRAWPRAAEGAARAPTGVEHPLRAWRPLSFAEQTSLGRPSVAVLLSQIVAYAHNRHSPRIGPSPTTRIRNRVMNLQVERSGPQNESRFVIRIHADSIASRRAAIPALGARSSC